MAMTTPGPFGGQIYHCAELQKLYEVGGTALITEVMSVVDVDAL